MTADRLVLWRHGQTDWNTSGRFQGQADIPLNAVGLDQARDAARVLATLEPAQLWSSDLTRTRQTSAALTEVTGLEPRLDERLREVNVGTWEGLRGPEIDAVEPEAWAALRRGEDVRRSPTGETVSEVGERVARALAEIAEQAPDGATVVVTTHGLAGRAGLCRLLGLPFDLWRTFGSLDNCAWSVLHRHRAGGYWRVAEHNVRPLAVRETIS
ncbi:histidine phosphatase family protein [Microlunatus flavus]|uniref:Probable phosphoglycerate mutase n=1 Tax=Microlunatus flavus TaxID=1036181 RepID=A0A1H9D5L1_9ACTN|nr:histidine phosphatase family protein [Microlunatus flavus]SEQ08098.1 probable phosphoglycerate mutase [Microlunatus flavus]